MKKILLTIFTTLVYFATFSQDIITKKSGDEIQAKVIEVGTSEIRYKIFTNLDGPTYTISKSEIFMVKYENGTKDVFQSNSAPAVSPSSPVNPETG